MFTAENGEQARDKVTEVMACLAPVAPKFAAFLERAEEDLIAFWAFG